MPTPFDQVRNTAGFIGAPVAGTILAQLASPLINYGTVYEIEIEIITTANTAATFSNVLFVDNGVTIERLFLPTTPIDATALAQYSKTYSRYTPNGILQLKVQINDTPSYGAFLRATPLRGLGVAS